MSTLPSASITLAGPAHGPTPSVWKAFGHHIAQLIGLGTASYYLFSLHSLLAHFEVAYGLTVQNSVLMFLVAPASIFSIIVGSLAGGMLGYVHGLRKVLLSSVVLQLVGQVCCAAAAWPSPRVQLAIFLVGSVVTGLGVGIEYSVAAVYAAHSVPFPRHGYAVGQLFTAQGYGMLAAALVNMMIVQGVCPSAGVCSSFGARLAWRVHPAVLVLVLVFAVALRWATLSRPQAQHSVRDSFSALAKLFRTRFRVLAPLGLSWLLFDMLFYGNLLVSNALVHSYTSRIGIPLAAKRLFYSSGLNVGLALVVLPSYYIAAYTSDDIGRRHMQVYGFILMAVLYTAIVVLRQDVSQLALFAIYFSTVVAANIGPNATTFILASESFPSQSPTIAYGILSATGKLGALCGALLANMFVMIYGYCPAIQYFLTLSSTVSILGACVSWFIHEPSKLQHDTPQANGVGPESLFTQLVSESHP